LFAEISLATVAVVYRQWKALGDPVDFQNFSEFASLMSGGQILRKIAVI